MKRWFVPALAMAASVLVLHAQGAAPAGPAMTLNVGDPAPDFTLPGSDGQTHSLAALKGHEVVLAWYPAAMTSGCTIECRQFRDSGEAIKKFDVAYFMASVDTTEKNKQFSDMEQANFPLLSDPDRKVAMAYGVVSSPTGRAQRWTFYIGPDGRIQYIDRSVNQHIQTAGADLATRLGDLKVKMK